MSIVMETPIKLKHVVELLDAHIAGQAAKRIATDEHPIANAMDRVHAQGGELALTAFKLALMEICVGAHEAVEGKRA